MSRSPGLAFVLATTLVAGGVASTAVAQGVRVPAEWEPQEAVWMQWPLQYEGTYQESFSRIIDAIQRRIGANVYSNISRHGNTSSTSIPLCLREVFPQIDKGDRLGLCAFGGGFTFGASIVEAL